MCLDWWSHCLCWSLGILTVGALDLFPVVSPSAYSLRRPLHVQVEIDGFGDAQQPRVGLNDDATANVLVDCTYCGVIADVAMFPKMEGP